MVADTNHVEVIMSKLEHKYGRTFFVLGIFLIILFGTSVARSQITTKSDENVEATESLTDMAFLAAKNLTISVQSTDDVFAAGGDINIKGAKADHLISAGGDIIVNNAKLKDLILAGGKIHLLSGTVEDDIVAAAGKLNIEPEFKVTNSAMLAASDLTINTPIGGDLRAVGESVKLKSNVAGDAQLFGETVTIGPNVRITGNLRYRAEDFQMDPKATVIGSVTKLEDEDAPDEFEEFGMKAVGVIAVFALIVTMGLAILVGASAAIFPGLMNNAAKMIKEKPLPTVGIGFLIVVTGPLILGLLFATVLGIPLALLIGAFYLVAAPLALAASAYFLGQRGRELFRKTPWIDPPNMGARIGWTFVGIVALILIGIVPILGAITWLLAYVFGMGAIATQGQKALARN